jgi:very-short-patch-repair endonuclease
MVPRVREHEQLPDRSAHSRSSAQLHVCHAVQTDIRGDGLDPAVVHVDLLIGRVAARQHGVITARQLTSLGVGRGALAHRIKRGLLHPIHRGVYLWGAPGTGLLGRSQAAALVCGADALLTHDASAALQGFRRAPAGPLDVTVPGRRVRVRGLRTHESPIVECERRTVRGIPVSSPARALLEIAPRLTTRELGDAVEQAQIKRLVTKQDIERAIERAGPRPGVVALRALLEEPAFTRSRAERRVVALTRAARLPPPVFNAMVEGYEVDALWRRERVVLEYDSYEFHRTKAALVRDRAKTAALQRARYTVLRTTWVELTKQSHALIARTAEALALSAGAQRA